VKGLPRKSKWKLLSYSSLNSDLRFKSDHYTWLEILIDNPSWYESLPFFYFYVYDKMGLTVYNHNYIAQDYKLLSVLYCVGECLLQRWVRVKFFDLGWVRSAIFGLGLKIFQFFFSPGQKNLIRLGQKVPGSKTGQLLIYCGSKVCSDQVMVHG